MRGYHAGYMGYISNLGRGGGVQVTLNAESRTRVQLGHVQFGVSDDPDWVVAVSCREMR